MRADIAMGADINDEGIAKGIHLYLVGAEQEHNVDLAGRRRRDHADHVMPALARNEAEIESTDPGGGRMEDGETVPAFVVPAGRGDLRRQRQDDVAIRPRQGSLPHDDQRPLGLAKRLGESVLPGSDTGQCVGAGAEVFVGIGQIDLLTDQADLEVAAPPAPADPRVEHGGLMAGIGADEQDRVGLGYPGQRRVEDVCRAAKRRIELGAVLPAVDMR